MACGPGIGQGISSLSPLRSAISNFFGKFKGFESFKFLKNILGPAGPGKAWHHIVNNKAANIAKYGEKAIQNIFNVIKIPHGKKTLHSAITAVYNTKADIAKGLTVGQWLTTKSYAYQYWYGIKTLVTEWIKMQLNIK
jgi:hypothetical protein